MHSDAWGMSININSAKTSWKLIVRDTNDDPQMNLRLLSCLSSRRAKASATANACCSLLGSCCATSSSNCSSIVDKQGSTVVTAYTHQLPPSPQHTYLNSQLNSTYSQIKQENNLKWLNRLRLRAINTSSSVSCNLWQWSWLVANVISVHGFITRQTVSQ